MSTVPFTITTQLLKMKTFLEKELIFQPLRYRHAGTGKSHQLCPINMTRGKQRMKLNRTMSVVSESAAMTHIESLLSTGQLPTLQWLN